ncbi:MAG TPA: endonuclease III [Xanthobacteraceae bacterium]|nr:endonuclease III [Xanthobacteraceae bacterium]
MARQAIPKRTSVTATRPAKARTGAKRPAKEAAPASKSRAGKGAAASKPRSASKSRPEPTVKTPRPRAGKLKPKPKLKLWTPAEVEEAFRRFQQANPEPRGELQHINPFTLLVAVVLSAQATDAGVNKATPALFAAADTPEKMVALGEDKVRDLIKTIGLFRTKARNVIALSRILVEEHGGMVPAAREALEALPGVGRKTANVVLNIAFGEKTIAVDTHIFRVGNRTGLAPGKNPLEVETVLDRTVPDAYKLHAHHWLILHGRYICVARKPLCGRCLINELCRWPEKAAPEFTLAERIATSASMMGKGLKEL